MTHTPNHQGPQFTPRRDARPTSKTEREMAAEQERIAQEAIEASHVEQRAKMRTYNARPRGGR